MTDHEWDVAERDVLGTLDAFLAEDRRAAIATIIAVEGSAYRRPGAKMLVDEEGTGQGHITAGCIEDEVLALVESVLEADEPRIERYDLMEDDDIWGLGLGCNGIIDVLVEPISNAYQPLLHAYERRNPVGVISVIDGESENIPLGAKAFYEDGIVTEADSTIPEWLIEVVEEPASQLVEQGKADVVELSVGSNEARVFIDGIHPAPRLLVLGSGHDVGPVLELGKRNGFHVEVAGFRGGVDLAERFPIADATHATKPNALGESVELDDSTYAVVMSHNFIDDRFAVESLIDAGIPYIGLMGPRKRFEEMLDAFADEDREFEESELAQVYTPIGLDLGAGSPYGIATSIVAEILAVHHDRNPRHLKEREGPIHERASVNAPAID